MVTSMVTPINLGNRYAFPAAFVDRHGLRKSDQGVVPNVRRRNSQRPTVIRLFHNASPHNQHQNTNRGWNSDIGCEVMWSREKMKSNGRIGNLVVTCVLQLRIQALLKLCWDQCWSEEVVCR